MKGTCVKCHRFTCKTNGLNGKILMAQLSAIDMGMFEVVDELESFVGGKLKEKGDNSDKVLKCIDSALNRITERAKTNSDEHSVKPVKNGVELRQSLLRAYLRNHLFKHVRRCQLCGRNNGTIKNDVGRCILIHFGVGTKSARYDDKKMLNEDYLTMSPAMDDNAELLLSKQLVAVENGTCDKLAWGGFEVRQHFRMLWKNESNFLRKVFPLFDQRDNRIEYPMDVLFCEKVLVPPTKYRPIRLFKGDKFEDPQTVNLRKLLEATETIRNIKLALKDSSNTDRLEFVSNQVRGKTMEEKLFNSYLALQQRIGAIFDEDLSKKFGEKGSIPGIKQILEKKQKALRMNYAPCKAYNADFDGDEMNGHFVQNYIAQTEVAEIANVGSNYLVPKDGTPLLGLIQDHVVSGVLLTMRGRFFSKEDFMHLVLSAFAETRQRIVIPKPAMLKPQVLWSGKQVISTILMNTIPAGQPRINLISKAKTPLTCWKVANLPTPKFDMSESQVIFRDGELLVGVLDKQHYGSTQYGLIHCCWELYGHRCATTILSRFSRLFTTYLQYHGFTLGVADILVTKEADKKRRKVIKALRKCGDEVAMECFGLNPETTTQKEIKNLLAQCYCNPKGDQQGVQQLDFKMKEKLNKFSEQINGACVPSGLIRTFPRNALQLMILCGSKGTMVNSVQISCGLGQIELEGHRPPITVVGRTLPSFHAFDTSPRSGGFVDQRFLTGINPQELFFHTMAGREGLIDTAVKTSRSGYLQRCIVKHLEGIVAHYDSTVRDHDNSVIQFRYGEDGMDVCRCTFMKAAQFDFLADNMNVLRHHLVPKNVNENDWNLRKSEKAYKKVKKWRKLRLDNESNRKYSSGFVEFSNEHKNVAKNELVDLWFRLGTEQRDEYERSALLRRCPPMADEKTNPTRTLGALPEKMLDEIDDYVKKKDSEGSSIPLETFRKTLFWKGIRCGCDPGENVGLLAAQSIGEPSTQMTLNTFHFAGRGEMNVTLGIPRLREILMTNGSSIKTPSAEIRAKPGTSIECINAIKRELDRVYLSQVIKKFSVVERVNLTERESWRKYDLTIEIQREKSRDENVKHLSCYKILSEIEHRFIKLIGKCITEREFQMNEYQDLQHKKATSGKLMASIEMDSEIQTTQNPRDEGMSSDEEETRVDADADEVRLNRRHLDDGAEYEGEDEERNVITVDNSEPNLEQLENESEDDDDNETGKKSENYNEQLGEDYKKRTDQMKQAEQSRIQGVIGTSPKVCDYKYDVKRNRWCTVTYKLNLNSKSKLDVASLVQQQLQTFVVSECVGIEKCIIREENYKGQPCHILATQGINIQALFKHADVLDVNSFYSNDLTLIWRYYGIEACARALVKEIVRVFTPYGIDVSRRHLTLTADYMTFTGQIQPFSRAAISSSASPLQKMTFETTVAFLKDAIVNGEDDYLSSPSARIVSGELLRGGTGAFDLLMPYSYTLSSNNLASVKEE
ncbi:unnamed protein product [Anisakis simplex]|uniref:DNA-directed RNA polymerase I subunit RPA1 n=1 Tax=Anisakis simplex TaxID=6269 RepID=A0A0M3K4X5_ANISI|nr:unnamed protein product [Anisakis simplex]